MASGQSAMAERLLNSSGRKTTQCLAILQRLRRGPATNHDLANISLKYTSRISDLRKAGFTIECTRMEASGVTEYVLKNMPAAQGRLF